MPKSNVVKTCLKLGGFPATASGLHDAILSGWAMIQGMENGESALLPPEAGLAYYTSNQTNVGISFPVNPPGSAISIALARKDKEFVVTALSTDGGAIPRNTTVEQGLALVEFGALTLDDFVRKACLNAARMFGLSPRAISGPAPMPTSPLSIRRSGRRHGSSPTVKSSYGPELSLERAEG